MKFFLIAIAMLWLAMPAFAQIEKGTSYLTGSIGGGKRIQNILNTIDGSTAKYLITDFNVTVDYGQLFRDTWAYGVQLQYKYNSTRNKMMYTLPTVSNFYSRRITNTYTSDFYVRKYFMIARNLYVYIDGMLDYSYGQEYINPDDVRVTTTGLSLFINAGATYFISKRVALLARLGGVGYGVTKLRGAGNPINQTNIETALQTRSISFGASIYFKH